MKMLTRMFEMERSTDRVIYAKPGETRALRNPPFSLPSIRCSPSFRPTLLINGGNYESSNHIVSDHRASCFI